MLSGGICPPTNDSLLLGPLAYSSLLYIIISQCVWICAQDCVLSPHQLASSPFSHHLSVPCQVSANSEEQQIQSILESSFFPSPSYIQCTTPGDAFGLIVITITFHPRWKIAACAFYAWPWGNRGWSWDKCLKFGPDSAPKDSILVSYLCLERILVEQNPMLFPLLLQTWKHLDPNIKFGMCYPFPLGSSLVLLRRYEFQAVVVLREVQCLAGQNV